MTLLNVATLPKNQAEVNPISMKDNDVLIAIIPGSRSFQDTQSDTRESIDERLKRWPMESGVGSPEKLIELMKSFRSEVE